MRWFVMVLVGSALGLAGCATRSISNSGYDAGHGHCGVGGNPLYEGELRDLDVLGIDPAHATDEAQIRSAIAQRKRPVLAPGQRVLLVQSGALVPDAPMQAALGQYFSVAPFSGVPVRPTSVPAHAAATPAAAAQPAAAYAGALRLAAARGGFPVLIVYWGILETAQENLATRTVSWVPVVGWLTPDQRQRMRISLRFAVVDVASGSWETYAPPPLEDRAISSMVGREASDQRQVDTLKDAAYRQAAVALAGHFGLAR